MKKKSRVIIIVCLFLSASFAQQQSYGLGFEFQTFPSLFGVGEGVLGIYVPIETGSLFIEPLIMYSSLSTEVDYDDYTINDSEYKESNLTLLLGIFKPTEIGKIRSYFGIRVGKRWEKKETDQSKEESDILIIAPTVGAEYFVSDNFSFGGEAMYTMTTEEEKDDDYDYTTTSKHSDLIPKLIVRFYF